jgi:hypothetical protein
MLMKGMLAIAALIVTLAGAGIWDVKYNHSAWTLWVIAKLSLFGHG